MFQLHRDNAWPFICQAKYIKIISPFHSCIHLYIETRRTHVDGLHICNFELSIVDTIEYF